MKINLLLILFLCILFSSYAQSEVKHRHYFPIWTYHQDNITVNGLSLGLYTYDFHTRNTNTNGIKLELIGMGWAVMFIYPPVRSNTYPPDMHGYDAINFSERVNGFYISGTGNICDCLINGISLGTIGQKNSKINGLSASVLFNYSEAHNGIQLSGMSNSTSVMRGIQMTILQNEINEGAGLQLAIINHANTKFTGIQIGLFNRSQNFRGIQIGLWNVNQDRSMPFINWNFKKK